MKSISLTNKSIVIILIVFTFLAYANSLFNSFVWDDYLVIVENNFIKSWKNFPLIFTRSYLTSASKIDYLGLNRLDAGEISYRPLVTASYFMDYSIWKLNPLGYHFTNIILHIFNVLLFYLFLSLLIKDRKSSLLASLFFALHPVNIEAVNCIAFREDLLAFLFFILSLILFVRFSSCESRKKIYFYVASLISYSLALFSKEMAITLPLVLILYDYYFVYKNDIKKIIADFKARYLAYIAVSLAYLWVLFFGMANKLREFPQYPGGSFYVNILTMSKVIAIYIKSLFLPVDVYGTVPSLSFEPAFGERSLFSPAVVISLFLIVPCLISAVRAKRSSSIITFSIFWFFITLLPVYNLIPLDNIMAWRYLYIPAAGFCLFLAYLLLQVKRKGKVIATAILAFYFIFTVIGNMFWKNSLTLWLETQRYHPGNAMVYNNLGFSYSSLGEDEKAIRFFKKAVELKPDYALGYYNLGNSFTSVGKVEEAIYSYVKAVNIYENFAQAYHDLAFIFLTHKELNKIGDAILLYKKAIEIYPGFAEAYNNLGVAYREGGRIKDAVSSYEKAIEINPKYAGAYYNLALAYKEKGQAALAEIYYKKAKDLGLGYVPSLESYISHK